MKNSETDRELTDLIRKTLDGYEEQYILGSWENFVRRRQKRRRLIFWLAGTGIAASLLTGWLGYKVLLNNGNETGRPFSDEMPSLSEVTSATDTSAYKDKQGIDVSRVISLADSQSAGKTSKIQKDRLRHADRKAGQLATEAQSLDLASLLATDTGRKEAADTGKALPVTSPPRSVNSMEETGIPGEHLKNDKPDQVKTGTLPQYSDNIFRPVDDPATETVTRSRRFRFGVNVSPGVATTTTNSSLAWAGGINADISLTKNLRISTGLQVEHQNITQGETSAMSSVPAGSKTANLVDFDLPLNLTWKFYAGKSSGYYISGGVSSVLYLSEKYSNTSFTQKMVEVVEIHDGQPSVSYELENVKTTEQSTEEPLSNIDLAGRINIIFGYEQHLSPKLFLHFEPYLKLPLSGLAGQDLKYTTSGISCKITF